MTPRQRCATISSVCLGQTWGPGWFKTNDHYDPHSCGNPSSVFYNVVDLTSWYDVPLGSSMSICTSQQGGPPFPSAEWTIVSQSIDATRCGHPLVSTTGNIMTVQRVALGKPIINPGGIVSFAGDGRFHSNTVVAIFGIDFYPSDSVFIQPAGLPSMPATLLYDNATLNGQINAQLPALPPGIANVFVVNAAGKVSDAATIVIN
jgi:hypothetical protein